MSNTYRTKVKLIIIIDGPIIINLINISIKSELYTIKNVMNST
jgi:hypothetical protein